MKHHPPRFWFGVVFFLLLSIASNSQTGILKIQTNQNGVEILVGNEPKGTVDGQLMILELPVGTYSITGRKENFGSVTKTATITKDQVVAVEISLQNKTGFNIRKSESASMTQAQGSLTVITDVPGAIVFLNGNEVNGTRTPFTVDNLGAGEWQVEARAVRLTVTTTVTVKPNETAVARLFFSKKREAEYQAALQREEQRLAEERRIAAERAAEETRQAAMRYAEQLRREAEQKQRQQVEMAKERAAAMVRERKQRNTGSFQISVKLYNKEGVPNEVVSLTGLDERHNPALLKVYEVTEYNTEKDGKAGEKYQRIAYTYSTSFYVSVNGTSSNGLTYPGFHDFEITRDGWTILGYKNSYRNVLKSTGTSAGTVTGEISAPPFTVRISNKDKSSSEFVIEVSPNPPIP